MPDDSGNVQKKGFIEKWFKPKRAEQKQQETEEEILSLVEEGQEKGLIKDDTKNIIENVFDFDDTLAYEIMTHRRDMTTLEDTDTLDKTVKVAIESGHSRIPVYKDDIDNIIGVLYVKDLLKYVCAEVPKDFSLTNILRKVLFVPRTKNCSSLFREMNKARVQIAIVVDEYGGTEGLITLEDLIEDILGNIRDEYDDEEDEIKKISDTKFTVDGSTLIEDVEELTGVKFAEVDSETIAGFILDKLGRIPDDNERPTIELDQMRLKIVEADDRRISKVLIELKQ